MKLTEEEKEQLASENFAYIHYFSKKYYTPQWDYDELVGAATVGMTKALNTFDKSKEIKFSTYSTRCIINAIFMFMRSEKKHLNNVSIEQSLVTDQDGSELTILDTLTAPERELDWREISPSVNKVLLNLSERDRSIMLMFFENKTQREIGDSFGLSQSYIARIIGKALKQIKENYWRGEKEVPKLTIEQYERYRADGLTDTQIAIKIDTSINYLGSLKRKWGLNSKKETAKPALRKPSPDKKDKSDEYLREIAELKKELESKESYIQHRENLVATLEARIAEYENALSSRINSEDELAYLKKENEKLTSSIEINEDWKRYSDTLVKENKDLRQEIEYLKYFALRYLAG